MKLPSQIDDDARFKGTRRHYHRSRISTRRTWEEWVEGENPKPEICKKRLKIAGIVMALLTLGGIITGLYMVLR